MSQSSSKQPDYQDYASYLSIWSPAAGDQELLMVKRPPAMSEMSEQDYRQLMTLRIQWLIHTWIARSGEDQVQTHRRLAQALRNLYLQESPNLYENPQTKELEPLWWWTQEWAGTFLEHNETFQARFRDTGIDFPIQIQPASQEMQPEWVEEHDRFTLENWLTNLIYGMTSD